MPKSKSVSNSKSNRLIGWLVSYAKDEKGTAHEIRAGRTIITSEDDQQSRIITIADADLSAPHLAMQASTKHSIMVQDIFSESGSFIVDGKSGAERAVSGPVELRHGDWIRVGATIRFQLCLIDGPNR
ncbi:MAG: hypothetical protein KDD42_00580 [Bdellovibrionales bacterium]|nr:hypothetical protein [Bdellovibrionales bacterium]